ncbi:MAG: hypothetical protein ACRDL6_01700 [Solirubrobacterales bacterium]
MSWLPGPSQIRRTAKAIKQINEAGGPRRLRLVRVERPRGHLFTSSEATLEVDTARGEVVRLEPELPVPFFYAWAYRLARRLGLPLASTLDPEDVSFEVPVPSWAWPG